MESGIRSVTTRTTLAAAGVLAALALTACGSTYDAAPPKNAADTAARGAASPTATATSASPEPTASGDAGSASDVGQTPTTLKATVIPKMGSVVVDEKGWVLYRYDKDTAKPSKSACGGDCAKVWPPVIADDQKLVGLDRSLVGEVTRADGAKQVTLAGWPLYYYIGDKRPGTWKGQNVGGLWWVITPEGKKNKTCVPANPSPAPKAPKPTADPTGSPSPAKSKADTSGYSY